MKTIYFKTFCKIFIALLVVLFFKQAMAATTTAHLLKTSVIPGDTSQIQKPGKFRKHRKIKKEDEDKNEDGVDDDIRARSHQEFMQQRDPKLNRVPLERLITARRRRDELLNNVKIRSTAPKKQGNVVTHSGNIAMLSPTISGLQWNERGPNNVGGRTRALIYDMGDAANGYKRVFAGGVGGGLWVTSDITASPVQWTKINDFFDNIAISCIAQNPVNPQEIYAGTGEGFLNVDAIQGLGVWKSSDGGATWAQLPSTSGFKYINAILVDKNGSVYIAGETDIFVGFGVDQSTDGGSTWTNVISASEAGADLELAANGDVYVSTGVYYINGHIFISDYAVNGAHTGNSGTWTNITPASNGTITPGTTAWDRIKLALAPNNSNIVYAFFETNQSTALGSVQQYNRSTNTWTVKTIPAEAFSNGQSWYSIAAAVDPNNSSILYAGSLDAERSTNGGATWTQYTYWNANTTASNYVHADHHAYVYHPGSSTSLLMGTDGGIFYTVNANAPPPSFVNKNNGYNVTQFYSVALHPTNFNYALAGAQDNNSEILQGAGIGSSTTATSGDGADVFIDQTNGNIQITSYVYDNYFLSTDNGASFNALGSYGNGQFINPTAYDPSTKSLYAGSASGYYYRAENVLSPAYNEVFVSNFSNADVTTVAVAPTTANRVYFGLNNGSVVMVDNAHTGTSLTGVVLLPSQGSNITTSCIAVDPTTENHILVTYSNYGIFHVIETKNANAATPTWADVSGNLPDMPARWALFYPGDPTKAIIATELGVWSTDLINGSSTTWDPTNTGLANVEVDMLTYRASDRTLAAATHGRGVFTCTLPAPATNDASLSNLTQSVGFIKHPNFASNIFNYASFVGAGVSSDTVIPTSTDPSATIKVNGTVVASGTASQAISLNFGANLVTIAVTAEDGVTHATYTDTIHRALSTNSSLSNLVTSKGVLTPTFVGTTLSYTKSVTYVNSSLTFTPTAADANATITVNGTATASGTASAAIPLSVGDNVINVVVTAQDGVTKTTYTVTVTRSGFDSSLSNLAISTGTLKPVFATATTAYTTNVGNGVTSITVTPATTDPGARVKVNGTIVTSGSASAPITLAVGPNTITTLVTSQSGANTTTYTITVTRAKSTNAKLLTLTTSAGSLTPAFSNTTTSYTRAVANTVTSITITPTVVDATATIKVNGTTVASGAASGAIPLNVGSNVINTVVTAQDGTTTMTYTITVNRALSADASLSNLAISVGTLKPVFATGTTSYTVSVGNGVTSVTVTPTTTNSGATVKVAGVTVASGSASGPIALAVGNTTITTVITAQNGVTTANYKIIVTRAKSSNAKLLSLSTSAGALTPAFNNTVTSYTRAVPNSTTSITFKPTVVDNTATVTVNGSPTASGTSSSAQALVVGSNVVHIVVTAQNGTTTITYTVTVNRATGPLTVNEPLVAQQPTEDGVNVHLGVSPNGDGVNDGLLIEGINKYPDNKLQIMSRSGQLIFETKGYDNNTRFFDGHSNKNGKMQLPGTYFYSLDYMVNGVAKHKSGFIVLKY